MRSRKSSLFANVQIDVLHFSTGMRTGPAGSVQPFGTDFGFIARRLKVPWSFGPVEYDDFDVLLALHGRLFTSARIGNIRSLCSLAHNHQRGYLIHLFLILVRRETPSRVLLTRQ
jgi:hypothetical protein